MLRDHVATPKIRVRGSDSRVTVLEWGVDVFRIDAYASDGLCTLHNFAGIPDTFA